MDSPLAQRSFTLIGSLGLGLALTTTLTALSGLLLRLDALDAQVLLSDPYLSNVLFFTLWQAFLSTLVCLILAIPLARALHHSASPRLRQLLFSLSLVAFTLPTLVLVSGLISLLGQQSLLSGWLRSYLPQWSIYGLDGILIAHVYLNLPFAVRVLTLSLDQLPSPALRLTRQMRLSLWQRLRWLEWPHLRSTLSGVACLIFILCFNSFAIVLTLGGGPAATTLEVAIYQALKYHFDLNEALLLCWLQLLIVGTCLIWMNRLGKVQWLTRPVKAASERHGGSGQCVGMLLLIVYGVFLLTPPFSLLLEVSQVKVTQALLVSLGKALLNSAGIATTATALALILGWTLLLLPRAARQKSHPRGLGLLEWLSLHTLPFPAMVLCVGLYVVLIASGFYTAFSLPVLIWLNALLVTPFVVTQLKAPLYAFDDQYSRLIQNWRPGTVQRCWLELRSVQAQLPALACLAALLILGDVAVFAIFGSPEWITLPWLIYQYAGSYRLQEAALASLVLLMISGLLVYRLEGGNHHA